MPVTIWIILEVVRDAARELSHRFHLLGVAKAPSALPQPMTCQKPLQPGVLAVRLGEPTSPYLAFQPQKNASRIP
jgi:hypothetical protein